MRFGRNGKAVERGQGTVEAAFVLPVLLGLVLFLLQPGIVLYDRVVMKSAAAEACQLLAVSGSDFGESEEAVRRSSVIDWRRFLRRTCFTSTAVVVLGLSIFLVMRTLLWSRFRLRTRSGRFP